MVAAARRLSGWGGVPAAACRVEEPGDRAALSRLMAEGDLIARGNGRAYGDAALNPRRTARMARFRRLLAFDAATGRLSAEAGATLDDVVAAFLSRGWFPAVVPGTRHVTLGGMIAADVHGKNHHRDGGMRAVTDWIDLAGPDGGVRRLGPGDALFDWTLGGMGLTGPILRAAIRLRPVETGWIDQTLVATPDLAATMAGLAGNDAPYAVAWVDALARGAATGRGLVLTGAHAARDGLPAGIAPFPPAGRVWRVPVPLPAGLLSPALLRGLNGWHHRRGRSAPARSLVDWEQFFFPLDRLGEWNRLHGRPGFVQFQCVLPPAAAADGLAALLRAAAAADPPCSLAVLKRLGRGGAGMSFPMPGWTLALDIPARAGMAALMDRLEDIAMDHGGRFYLAKDARLTAARLTRADPRAEAFRALRAAQGWTGAFRSLLSDRLAL